MSVQTSAGSKLYIGTTAADGASDTYTEVAEVTNIGEFGRSYNNINHDSLSNRNTLKFKGQRDDGNMQIDLGRSAGDAGQAAMQTALDSDFDYNVKITLNDQPSGGTTPTTFIMKAKVMSYTTVIGNTNQVVQAKATFGIKTGSITETAAA